MIGAKNWREDIDAVGPVNKNLRQCDPEVKAAEPQIGEGIIPAETFNEAVAASLILLPKKTDKIIAVVCGDKGKDACKTAESLKKNPKVDNVISIWTCGSMEEGKDADKKVTSDVYMCDPKELKRVAKIEEQFSAVVIDPEASPEFVQSLTDVFCKMNDAGQHALLRDDVSFMTSLNTDAEATFFAGCVKKLILPNVRSSRIIIDKTSQFGLIGTGNKGFVRKTVEIQQAIQKATGIRTIVDKMVGGPVQQQTGYDPDHYPANAYDERDALRQYTNQNPIASQSLYHFQIDDKNVKTMSSKLIKETLNFVVAKNTKFAGAKRVDFSDKIGDGAVSAAIIAGGHIIVTWDGASKVTVNILTPGEKYEPTKAEVPDMVLADHKSEVIDVFMSKLPPASSTGREQMPRGSNRVVNFKKDINAIPNCTDHFDMCLGFSKDGDCDDDEDGEWMHRYCSLSCGTCDKMIPLEEE
jgi:S-adenosylmethionine/arginine decarboxylase-like enzyme